MLMTLAQIVAACRAEVAGNFAPGLPVRGTGMDSRAVVPGSLFVCVKGERADGHDFAAQGVQSGAAAVLAERGLPGIEDKVPVLVVPDCVKALGQLASAWREAAKAKVVAVTGTAGKTTVKEMILAGLGRRFEVCGTRGNYNNQLGLPLTMLSCPSSASIWVLELGISRPGDMEELAVVARPDLAVITNIGPAHLEGLGDLSGVARAKAAVAAYLAPGGRVLASRDFPLLVAEIARHTDSLIEFSTHDENAAFHAAYLGANCTGGRFTLRADGQTRTMTLPFFGQHAAANLAAAAGAALLMGATIEDVEAGLTGLCVAGGRFKATRLGGLTLIDDTYNANPLSMACSIAAAAETAPGEPLVLVLGEMRELGSEAAKRHAELGRLIAASPCAAVFFHGGHAEDVRQGLSQGGYTGTFEAVEDPDRFAKLFASLRLTSGAVLFKGSRSLGMERFLAAAGQTAGVGA